MPIVNAKECGVDGQAAGVVIAPGEGNELHLSAGERRIKVGPHLGSRLVGLMEASLQPSGGFAVPHVHDEHEEVFYVLDGEIEYLIGSQWTRATAGTTIFIPPGTVHAFRNRGPHAARQLMICGPSEIMQMMEELSQVPSAQWEQVHERYHSHYAPDPTT
jgi:quercetin dioxygenase-like cupin family protein